MPPAQLKAFFETAVSGATAERQVWKSTRVRTFSTPTTVLFETQDLDADGVWLHKTFVQKEKEGIVVPLDSNSHIPQQQIGRPLR
jgi:hypothetical protein